MSDKVFTSLLQVSVRYSTLMHKVLKVVPGEVEVEGEDLGLVHLASGQRPPTLFKERRSSWSNHLSSSCDAFFSFIVLCCSWLLGRRPEYTDPKVVAQGEGREGLWNTEWKLT